MTNFKPPPGHKFCGGPCQQVKSIEEFAQDKSTEDGRQRWCASCRRNRRIALKKRTLDSCIEKMDERLLLAVAKNPIGGTNLPHKVQLLEEMLGLMGGVQGLAAYCMANMHASRPGSETRTKILNKLIALVEACSDDGKISKPLSECTDEEVDARLKEHVARLAHHTIVDADVRESA